MLGVDEGGNGAEALSWDLSLLQQCTWLENALLLLSLTVLYMQLERILCYRSTTHLPMLLPASLSF